MLVQLPLPPLLPAGYTAESLKAATNTAATCAYIRNAHFKEYMYTSTIKLENNDRRLKVFTWMNKVDGNAADWKRTWAEQGSEGTITKDCGTLNK